MNTLVMIPAFGCDARLYAPQVAALSDRVQPHVVTTADQRFAGMVDQVLEAAPDSFVILGTSMGGRVTLETALAAPERHSVEGTGSEEVSTLTRDESSMLPAPL